MKNEDFIAYVGDSDIHDAVIEAIFYEGMRAEVTLSALNGRELKIQFSDVHRIESLQPIRMILYALIEMRCQSPYRRFVFGNSDDNDPSSLVIEAKDFSLA